jgi:hypothetical protein
MVPIPADPQRDLEDESVAVISESLFDRHRPAEEAFLLLLSDRSCLTGVHIRRTERSVL